MRRRGLLIVALIVAIATLGVGLWWSYRPAPKPHAPPVISDLSPARVQRIRIRHGADLIVIDRDGSQARWHLSAPVTAPVDKPHLAAMLALLGQQARRRYDPGAIADTTTGLANPRLVVRFDQTAPIKIGGEGPSRGSGYVATPHDLLLADLPKLGGLQWGWTHWISPALAPPDRRLMRIVLPRFTLARKGSHWQAQPQDQRAPAAIAATVQTWQRARALAVIPADQSRQRIARITLGFEHGPPRHLDIIERRPNLILRDPDLGVDYHLAGNRVAPLLDIRHPGLTDADSGPSP